jgi:hypothetical protein
VSRYGSRYGTEDEAKDKAAQLATNNPSFKNYRAIPLYNGSN